MSINFAIIGGDLRIVKLVNLLINDGNIVYIYGLEKAEELKDTQNIIFCDNIEKAIDNCQIVISSIPLSSDNIYIHTPFSNDKILLDELSTHLKNKIFISGNIEKKINSIKTIDVLKREELSILNAISTVEGAIEIAISNTDKTIYNNNVLILGFGRIGKVLSDRLRGLKANVSVTYNNEEENAWIQAYGYNPIKFETLSKNIKDYDIIINTIPHKVLNKDELFNIKKDSLIIDLASRPGGVDQEISKDLNIKLISAMGLPGKVAPVSSAKIIKDTIYNVLNETYIENKGRK